MTDDREQAAARRKIRKAVAAKAAADDTKLEGVAEARHLSVTWEKVGEALGMRQPHAHRKYAPLLKDGKLLAAAAKRGVTDPAAALRKIRSGVTAKGAAETAEVEAVAAARRARLSWYAIADELGVKEPNAHYKFAPLLKEELRVTIRGRD